MALDLQDTLDALEAIRLQTVDFVQRSTAIAEQASGEHVPEDPVFNETEMQNLLDDVTPTIASLFSGDIAAEIQWMWYLTLLPYFPEYFGEPVLLSTLGTQDVGGEDHYVLPLAPAIYYLDGIDPADVRVVHPPTPESTFYAVLMYSKDSPNYGEQFTVFYSFMEGVASELVSPHGLPIAVGRASLTYSNSAPYSKIIQAPLLGGVPPVLEEEVLNTVTSVDNLFQEMGSVDSAFSWSEWSGKVATDGTDESVGALEALESGGVDSYLLVSADGVSVDADVGISLPISNSVVEVGGFEDRDTYAAGVSAPAEKILPFSFDGIDYVLITPGKTSPTAPYTDGANLRLLEIDVDEFALRDSVSSEYSLFIKTYVRDDKLLIVNAMTNGEDVLTIKSYLLDTATKTLTLESTSVVDMDDVDGVNDILYEDHIMLAIWSDKASVSTMLYSMDFEDYSFSRLEAAESDLFREMKNIFQLDASSNVATDFVYIGGVVRDNIGTINKARKLPAVSASNIPFRFSNSGGDEEDITAQNANGAPMITRTAFHGSGGGYSNVVFLSPNKIGVEKIANHDELWYSADFGAMAGVVAPVAIDRNTIEFEDIGGLLFMVTTSLSEDVIRIRSTTPPTYQAVTLEIAVDDPVHAKYFYTQGKHFIIASTDNGADVKLYETSMDEGLLSWRSWNFPT